jgi:hypothetical protein
MKDSIYRLCLWVLILGILYYFGWVAPHGEQFIISPIYGTIYPNVDDFHWQVHPFKFWDAFGMLLFAVGTFVICGAYKLFFGELFVDKGEATAIIVIAAILSIFGILLMYV